MLVTTRPDRGVAVRLLVAAALLATTLVVGDRGASAEPGQLTPVTDFGSNPGSLLMFEYVPADLPPNAPVVVVLHGCFASAALYDDETGWRELAERWKAVLVLPEQTAPNEPTKCFGFWKPEDNQRGQGEAASVAQMVARTHAVHGTDPARTFVMGHSGGGLYTSVLLATYPDVFSAGAVVAGGPYGCGDEGALIVGPHESKSPVRGGECVDGSTDRTAQEWGDLARSGYPGYAGPKPRVAIFHGTADTMVTPKNLNELVEQWTDYHGIDQQPEVVDTVSGYPHAVHAARKRGPGLVESYEITGGSHGWSYDAGSGENQCSGSLPSTDSDICVAYHAGRWFGLDEDGPRRRGQ